jgi:hypothetical protein
MRNVWGSTHKLPDGTFNINVTAQFVAKNLTDSNQRLIVAKIVKPRFDGSVFDSFVVGEMGSFTDVWARENATIMVQFFINSPQAWRPGSRDAVIEITNDEGHSERARLTLRHIALPSPPTGAASTSSPAVTSHSVADRETPI